MPTATRPSVSPPSSPIETNLPDGWVPADVVIRMWARHNAGYGWETIVPEFSIAGQGETLDDAVANAIELLEDYLSLCVREGRSFAASRRPLPIRETARLAGEFAVGKFVGRLASGHGNRRKLDVPLHAVAAHGLVP